MSLDVHYYYELTDEEIQQLKNELDPNIMLTHGKTLPPNPSYEILIAGLPDPIAMESSPNLKSLVIPWAGFPRKTADLLQKYPHISVHNIHHNAITTAETAITLLLACAKELIPLDKSLRQGDWTKRYEPSQAVILHGKQVLLLGYGAIGKQIHTILNGFGMHVEIIRRTNPEPHNNIYDITSLHNRLPHADVIILALPWTSATDSLFKSNELSLLKKNSILVNISRGNIIEEKALYNALCEKRFSAGLDVWYNYPEEVSAYDHTPPSKYPFEKLSNTVMTPHIGGHSTETTRLRISALSTLLNERILNGHFVNKIDIDNGY